MSDALVPVRRSRVPFLRLMWAFFVRDAKIAMSYRAQFFFQIAGVFSVCVTFFFLSLMMRRVEGGIATLSKYGGSYFAFVLVGTAFSTFLDSSLRTFAASIRTAQMTGTLEAMLTTKTAIGPLVAGSAIYTLVFTTVRTLLYLVFGALVFQVSLRLETWPQALVVFALTATSTMALGIFSAGFIVWFKQGDPVTAAISGLSWLLSGVLYPKEILPHWVQQAASFLPMTHTLESMRLALLTGAPAGDLGGSITYLAVFSLVGTPLAIVWFQWAVARAKVDGSLARY
ncbi:ABC transporter permease [Myxococcota bacterium]|nr:ABC transporter permease [Myxococcota bacterium]